MQDFWTINSFTFDSSLQNWACTKLPTYLFHLFFFRTCAIGKVSSPESQSGVRNCCQATICQTNMSQSPDLIRGWYWDCWPRVEQKIFKDQIRKCTKIATLGYIHLFKFISSPTKKNNNNKNTPLVRKLSIGSHPISPSPAAWIAQSHHGHGHLRPTSSNRGQGQPSGPGLGCFWNRGIIMGMNQLPNDLNWWVNPRFLNHQQYWNAIESCTVILTIPKKCFK